MFSNIEACLHREIDRTRAYAKVEKDKIEGGLLIIVSSEATIVQHVFMQREAISFIWNGLARAPGLVIVVFIHMC